LATMTTKQNKDLVRLQFELLNNGDVEGAASLWAAVSFNHGRRVDPQTIQAVYASLKQLEERHSLQEMVAEGEWVAVRTTCEGRHATKPVIPVNSGVFSEVEPTGRKYAVQHMHLFRIVDGKITEHWANRDDLGAAKQIGLDLRAAD
jgi:ketosteroid isomerase-like protein